ncbi:uncharacterized protein CC84DRAFT_37420 [Paraphaeosphaeria sporulosa]|uniref:Uncharacterized protein n=1 Tax=Paraphaeosphaeria sporulosa TaxID=1460663 RepID=A0A177CW72_9PLEO|nr:uncharacterized protein CC84DRAFT_37420 [Paraphaeosphaeria sporulosa]OAG11461.1 hypothetical protein CC84DRAFT_37420 [Paraphaeosphaeria sporulosa]
MQQNLRATHSLAVEGRLCTTTLLLHAEASNSVCCWTLPPAPCRGTSIANASDLSQCLQRAGLASLRGRLKHRVRTIFLAACIEHLLVLLIDLNQKVVSYRITQKYGLGPPHHFKQNCKPGMVLERQFSAQTRHTYGR